MNLHYKKKVKKENKNTQKSRATVESWGHSINLWTKRNKNIVLFTPGQI